MIRYVLRLSIRTGLPLAAVLIVLIAIATMLFYAIPAANSRLESSIRNDALAQASAVADAIQGKEGPRLQQSLDLSSRANKGQTVVVDQGGQVVARGGPSLFTPGRALLRTAAEGERRTERFRELRVAIAPVTEGDRVVGGVVFATREPESSAFSAYLRSSLEAAAIASVVGGGLMLLLSLWLTRRIGRLSRGAQAIKEGALSYRVDPARDDELGKLASYFNSMAERLEVSFSQLEETQATLSTILDNLNEGVLLTDLEGHILYSNYAAHWMLAMGDAEHPRQVPNPWEDFDLPAAVARCAEKRDCAEAWIQEAERLLRVNLESLEDEKQRGGVLVVVQDLSESRQLEATQQRFIANAGHELKTPITVIRGAAELLLDGADEDPEVRRRFLGHIQAQSLKMQRLSETLLRLARTGYDVREPNIEKVELHFLKHFAERVEPLVKSADARLYVEDQGNRIYADEEWLEQALLILVSNAVKHSESDGCIWLRAKDNVLSVEDEGEGVNEADLPYIFERHYKGRSSPEGFGLGLPICKELIERMGGEISIDSKEGVGTSVEIELLETDGGSSG